MYWSPIIFIVFELIYIISLSEIIKFTSVSDLNKQLNNVELERYIEKKYKSYAYFSLIFLFVLLGEFVYFCVGLSKEYISYYSAFFLTYILVQSVITQLSKKKNKDKSRLIKLSELSDFETNDIKLQRLLKMNEFKNDVKIHKWKFFISPIIKFLMFLSIVILHYNFNLL